MNLNALAPKFYLMVMDARVHVGYGMCPCPHLTHPTTRAYWLVGDHSKLSNGIVVPPKMYRSHGNIGVQFVNFQRTDVAAMALEDLQAAFAADGGLALAPALQPAADGTAPPQINVWKALPVHQKVACLFMAGVPVRYALATVVRLVGTIPPEQRAGAEGLVGWIRAAATSNGAANPVSMLESNARRLDTAQSPLVEEWFYNVVSKYSPRGDAGRETPRAELTAPAPPAPVDARLVDILDLLQKNQTSGALASSEGKAYMPHELNVLFMVSGQPAPWNALTEAQIPPVFQKLRPFRKTTASTRLFLERFLASSYPMDRPQYDFVFSTEIINDIRQLSFNGSDLHSTWEMRADGFSLFSVAPTTAKDGGVSLKARLKAYEDTHDNHDPKDRAAHAALSRSSATALSGVAVPGDRRTVQNRLEFFHIMCGLLFGTNMPLLRGLEALHSRLYRDTDTRHWSASKWRALFWNLHCGIRAFFFDGDTGRFNTTVNRFIQGMGPEESNVPLEALQPNGIIVTPPGSDRDDMSTITDHSGWSSGSGSSGGSGGSGGSGTKRKTDDSGSDAGSQKPKPAPEPLRVPTSKTNLCPFARPFQTDIDKARAVKTVTARIMAPNRAARMSLFGEGFLKLLPSPTANPCVNHWILGHCPDNGCPNAHQLTARPSDAVHKQVGANVKRRCEAIVASAANDSKN